MQTALTFRIPFAHLAVFYKHESGPVLKEGSKVSERGWLTGWLAGWLAGWLTG
jgi:hypothetical protein